MTIIVLTQNIVMISVKVIKTGLTKACQAINKLLYMFFNLFTQFNREGIWLLGLFSLYCRIQNGLVATTIGDR